MYTARSREHKTPNGYRNANRNPRCYDHGIQGLFLKGSSEKRHEIWPSRISICIRRAFRISSYRDRAVLRKNESSPLLQTLFANHMWMRALQLLQHATVLHTLQCVVHIAVAHVAVYCTRCSVLHTLLSLCCTPSIDTRWIRRMKWAKRVLLCVAVCCSVPAVAEWQGWNELIMDCSVLQCVAVCCSAPDVTEWQQMSWTYVLQCVAVCWSVFQCIAVCCSAPATAKWHEWMKRD